MLHGVFKENQVHDGIDVIVLLEGFLNVISELVIGHDIIESLTVDSARKIREDQVLRIGGREILGELEFGE